MRNKVIGYEGGGYDGCFWEPNFAYIDQTGKVYDLYSSGRAGMFKDNKQVYQINQLTDMQSYPVTQEGINTMLQDYRQDFVVGVVKMLCNDFDLDLGVKCDKCESIADANEIEFESYTGDGGIGIISDGIICSECYNNSRCINCCEYDSDLNEYGLCSYCLSEIEGKIPQIEKLQLVMKQGNDKLAEISKLNPKRTKQYTEQHNKACAEIHNEIAELIQSEIE